MARNSSHTTWLCCIFFITISTLHYLTSAASVPKLKAVNLGGWLVTEGWIEPSLFDGIPNKNLLDGTHLQFMSVVTGKYLVAENGGGTDILSNRNNASGWETFKVWRLNETHFQFLVFNGQFVGVDQQGVKVMAIANSPGKLETFQMVMNQDNVNRVRIKSSNGLFLQAKSETLVTADGIGDGWWGDNDPTVFLMTTVTTMRGEFQVTNGYGKSRAEQVMKEHWNSFIVEDDFKYIAEKGLNAVRIPVGWWIASDPSPPWPFVGGSLQALDKAFTWADKYGLGIIVDLHAAPGSQNGQEHGGSRDGNQLWGKSDEHIQQTVSVVDFLASRYAARQSLLAVSLLNEPSTASVTLPRLKNYYTDGYNAVRKYSPNAYVIMSAREPNDLKDLVGFAGGLNNVVIDLHYYNLFWDGFVSMTVQQNIDYINNDRANELSSLTTTNGPLTFVGEWAAEWNVGGATPEDYKRFAAAMLDVYGRASFGWAYWTYKNVNNHWSLRWMIDNGYITIPTK